ncbi:MAG: hypothetical protein DLM71_04045 [Chloroflexi bacterium]|nr:MAG: hypothetical protein DLM71_04045 [Chloroflexota bacterium]
MSERAFSEARRKVVGAHRQADYQSALRIAEEAAIEFPDRADKTAYWVACLYALLGDRERALRILEDGFARGHRAATPRPSPAVRTPSPADATSP